MSRKTGTRFFGKDRRKTGEGLEPVPVRLWRTGAVMQMPVFSRLSTYAVTVGALLASAASALADTGEPSPWGLGLQASATPVMDEIHRFHNILLIIITLVTVFVLALLVIVMVR